MNTFSKNQVNFYTVTNNDIDQRIDNLLIKILKNIPKSHIYKIIRSGEVKINNKKVNQTQRVQLNDIIRIPPLKITANTSGITSTKIPNISLAKFIPNILFEDEFFLIINKPANLACHGGSGISFGLIELLRQLDTYKNNFLELAHRLDRDTSGILIFAKQRSALIAIQNIIKNNLMHKNYISLSYIEQKNLHNNAQQFSVELPLYKYLTPSGERRVRVDKQLGKYAKTIFQILESNNNFILLKAQLKTGRTHQIRVHLQSNYLPIVGDTKYGNDNINKELQSVSKRMFLHAYEIKFTHPINNQKIHIISKLPKELINILNHLNLKSDNIT